MAMTATEVLTLVAPEVAALGNVASWIAYATEEVPATPWGSVRAKGIANLAAHLAWCNDPTLRGAATTADSASTSASGVTAKSAGDLSESYGGGGASAVASHPTASLGDKALLTTRYGVEFVRLRNSLPARMPGLASVYP